MIDFEEIQLNKLITHLVGNKLREEGIELSVEETHIDDETRKLLLNYFFSSIKQEESFCFTHAVDLEMNEVYAVVKEMFADHAAFIPFSQNLAKLLYEQSTHPKINAGKLNITYLSNVIFEDEVVDAIGIFKSERDVPFIKMSKAASNFNIEHEYGFEIKGIDKGCVILNTEETTGYKILIVDSTSRSAEAQYWKDDFLNVKPISNEFHQTNQFLSITKDYFTKEITKEFEVSKTDQIDLLNRSVEYFKEKDSFDKQSFEEEVLQSESLIESFENYNTIYKQENDIELTDSFEISTAAVKKQARVFNKVLKLDKNFHIYIHGNKELIEQGVDEHGRKFYKIFYEEEK